MNITEPGNRNGHGGGHGPARRATLAKAVALVLAIVSFASVQPSAVAGPREQAKRMYDRLTGTPPSPALLTDLEARVQSDPLAAPCT